MVRMHKITPRMRQFYAEHNNSLNKRYAPNEEITIEMLAGPHPVTGDTRRAMRIDQRMRQFAERTRVALARESED